MMKKIMVSLTPELERELIQLKKESYEGKTETEMYQDLIHIGLTNVQKNVAEEKNKKKEG